METNNVVLTGLPRSGTTLTCHLLNRLEDTVALHEPMRVHELPQGATPEQYRKIVGDFFEQTRASLLGQGTAVSKHHAGAVPDNPITNQVASGGVRVRLPLDRGEIHVEKQLTSRCMVVVKHPSAFSALLPLLVERFRCFALVRNPLAVLSSWNSVPFNVRNGHAPAAERLAPELERSLQCIDSPLDRQLHLLDWFYGQFRDWLPGQAVIRYEDMVASGGRKLAVITPRAAGLSEPLESRNANAAYDHNRVLDWGQRVLETAGAWREFYDQDEIARLLPRPVAA